MNTVDFMFTDEYEELEARYEKQFDDRIPTVMIIDLPVEEFKQEIENSIKNNEPLLPQDKDIIV